MTLLDTKSCLLWDLCYSSLLLPSFKLLLENFIAILLMHIHRPLFLRANVAILPCLEFFLSLLPSSLSFLLSFCPIIVFLSNLPFYWLSSILSLFFVTFTTSLSLPFQVSLHFVQEENLLRDIFRSGSVIYSLLNSPSSASYTFPLFPFTFKTFLCRMHTCEKTQLTADTIWFIFPEFINWLMMLGLPGGILQPSTVLKIKASKVWKYSQGSCI